MEGVSVFVLFAAVTGVKLLFMPAYRSTDFEVHRNWMAITHSLPLHQWYVDATSQWTLDYPPLFAYFERVLALGASLVDPAMLTVTAEPYASDATVFYQRVTVMLADVLLFFAVHRFCHPRPKAGSILSCGHCEGHSEGHSEGRCEGHCKGHSKAAVPYPGVVLALVTCSAGLFIVDHVHFQYNGPLLGLLILSLAFASEGRDVASAATFAALVCAKHLFAYAAPAYAVFLLRRAWDGSRLWNHGHRGDSSQGRGDSSQGGDHHAPHSPDHNDKDQGRATGTRSRMRVDYECPTGALNGKASAATAASSNASVASVRDASQVGDYECGQRHGGGERVLAFLCAVAALVAAVAAVVAVAFGPFLWHGQLPVLLARMFPFGRGLCHAYWAPNLWALYNLADKALTIALPRLGVHLPEGAAARSALNTGGLVGSGGGHVVLPQVTPGATFVLVLVSLAPALWRLWQGSGINHYNLNSSNKSNNSNNSNSSDAAGLNASGPVARLDASTWAAPGTRLVRAVSYSYLAGFIFGWHVHEKACLMFLLPAALLANRGRKQAARYLLLSTVTHLSLFPLLYEPREWPIQVMLAVLYALSAHVALRHSLSAQREVLRSSDDPLLPMWQRVYLLGLCAVHVYATFLHGRGPLARVTKELPFLPLMLVSCASAPAVVYVFLAEMVDIVQHGL